MDLARMIEALSDPAAYPSLASGRRGRGPPDAHLGRLPGRTPCLQDQEAARPGVPRLQHAGAAPPFLRAGGPAESPPGAVGLPRRRPRDPRRHARRGGGPRRGHRMGREDGPPARRRHAPGAAPTRGDRRRADRGPGPPHRRVPRPRRGRRVDLGLRPPRGGGPQRPRELRGVGIPGGHDDQPGRVRAAPRR